MDQVTFDFTAAANAGIQQSYDHACRVDDEWPERAFEYLRRYARVHPEFTVEQMTAAADREGYGSPTDSRSWGGIVRKAQNKGLIRATGRTAPRSKGHGSPGIVWASVVAA